MVFVLLTGLPVLVWLVSRRRHRVRRLSPVGPPEESRVVPQDAARIWVLPDSRQRLDCMVSLARSRHAAGRVLLCPQAESRGLLSESLAGLGGVLWAGLSRPSPAQLMQLAIELDDWGRGLVLVEGLQALEAADESEGAAAVIEELVENWSESTDLLVLLTRSEVPAGLAVRELSVDDLVELGVRAEASPG